MNNRKQVVKRLEAYCFLAVTLRKLAAQAP